MADFKDLDPDTRCYALVGQYLQSWAVMEVSLHDCIQTAFNLTMTVLDIICANLRLYDKLHIARTIVYISAMTPEADKSKYQKILRDIGEYSPQRNMVAHDFFAPDDEGKGVEFFPIKAKGKYELPKTIWTADRFQEEEEVIKKFISALNELNKRLKVSPIRDEAYRRAMAQALIDWQPISNWKPTPRTALQGLLSFQSPPPLTLLDSDPANQERTSQTPLSPQKKEEGE